jgi:hypothetical protein
MAFLAISGLLFFASITQDDCFGEQKVHLGNDRAEAM